VSIGDAILADMADRPEPIPHIEHYGNGNVKMRGAHLAGEMHGPWEFYRLDGSLMRSGAFDRGGRSGRGGRTTAPARS
jgi:hypothetical protein